MIFNTIFLQAEGGSSMLLPMVAMFAIIFIFMIIPQNRRRKKEKQFRAELKKGSKVVTSSGIHGKIAEINDKDATITIETGAGKIKFEREAVSVELTKKHVTPPATKK